MDSRPSIDSALEAFGLPAVVTRPAPDNTAVTTTGFWSLPREGEVAGSDFGKLESQKLLVLPKSALSTLPRGTQVVIAETSGAATKTWLVEGLARVVEVDCWRALMKQTSS